MGVRAEKQITINAPADKVFEYVADFARHPEWAGNPLEVSPAGSGPAGVGSSFTTTGKFLGTHTDTVTVAEYSPPTKLVLECQGDAGQTRNSFTLREAAGATVLSKGFELTKPSFMSRLFTPFIALSSPKSLTKDLERIKSRVEGSA